MTSDAAGSDPLLLPPGTRLVHVGPHKTGTTAIQSAMHGLRSELLSQGVLYAYAAGPQAYLPARSLIGHGGRRGGPVGTGREWQELVAEAEAAGDMRVVISSESFSNALPTHIHRLADDLGRDRVHIVRMVRRYDKLLPSQWQQGIYGAGTHSFGGYYSRVLADADHTFWRRHGFERHTRLWADAVGPERVTVVVVDETDRTWLLRVMERFTGLREGTLTVTRRENRSLTGPDAEFLRNLNRIASDNDWPDPVYHDIRAAVSPALKNVDDPEAARVVTPPEVYDELRAVSLRDIDGLRDLGVRIVGDVESLVPPERTAEDPDDRRGRGRRSISVESGAAAVEGIVREVGRAGRASPGSPRGHRSSSLPAVRPLSVISAVGPAGATFVGAFAERAVEPDAVASVLHRRPWRQVCIVVTVPWQDLIARWQAACLDGDARAFGAWCAAEGHRAAPGERVAGLVDSVGPRRVTVVLGSALDPEPTLHHLARVLGIEPTAPARREVLAGPEVRLLESCAAKLRAIDGDLVSPFLGRGLVPGLLGAAPAPRRGLPDLDEHTARIVRRQSRHLLRTIDRPGIRVIGEVSALRRAASVQASEEPSRLRPAHLAAGVAGVIEHVDYLGGAAAP